MLCLKAHAKINWTLDILGTRKDGYHLMDMLMQSVDMHDTLWIEEADTLILEDAAQAQSAKTAQSSDELSSAAVTYDESNLVYRAAKKLRDYCGVQKGAHMRLLKTIPSGAGMGGGSADAAAALRGLVQLWKLDITEEELLKLGLSLGADIPFMLTGGLARVGGIGEEITPLSPAPEVHLVMLQPCGGLSTKEVFGAFDALDPNTLARPQTDIAQTALVSCDLASLGKNMNNVLEGVSVQARPATGEAAKALEAVGAIRGMMTGSGSVVYGVFASREAADAACQKLRPIAQQNGWGEVWTTHTLGE
jgi:4-diphosphocytidyl-2-C-methyl-D-erythritol kinase